ncbi:MAG TPA: EAL domain-containing protein, partial [Gaiellaceae bacterium]|nr:EAL domain-containing protein [Gaiellaceae bacterium]
SACSQTQAWRSQLPGRDGLAVCVNLSAVEFRNPRLCAEVAAAVLDAGLDARRLVLEITEATAMEDVDAAQQTMSELRRLGVRLALDGFGSGRSALDQLCRLPFDTLKIARPLVERIGSSRRDDRVARAIVGMAGSLGLEVIAEGIESAEQALRLREAGCRFGQGFYFDRALAVAVARRRLESTERDRAHLYLAPS